MKKFIARQPILNRNLTLFGYELLFRAGLENYFTPNDSAAAIVLVDSTMVFGLDLLTGGAKAFFNFTEEALVRDFALLLPQHCSVIEVLETVEPGPEVVSACQRLKEANYPVALDDFTDAPKWQPLVQLADILKVDFRATPPAERRALIERYSRPGLALLAEKVETHSEFEEALSLGYAYFQGHFFYRPQILEGRDIPAFKLSYLRILHAIHRPELDFGELENIIKHEPSLCYKLLRYLNSPVLGFRGEIRSIRHAMALLGEEEFRKWVSVVAVVSMAGDKPLELLCTGMIRARFCESLSKPLHMTGSRTDLFLTGLLSVMDAVLDRPLGRILAEIPVAEEVRRALAGERNRIRDVFDIVIAYERADWEALAKLLTRHKLEESVVPDCFFEAVEWTKNISAA